MKNLFFAKVKFLIMSVMLIQCLYGNSQSLKFQWAQLIIDYGLAVHPAMEVDSKGNMYIAGGFSGTRDFDPGAGIFTLTSNGNTDMFISKFDRYGQFLWARQMGGASIDVVQAIEIDTLDDIYISGRFEGTVDFDPGTGTYPLTSLNANASVISKFNGSGNMLWAKKFDVYTMIPITLDLTGNVYAAGYFNGKVDFDPDAGVFDLTDTHNGDVFYLKLNTSGKFVWALKVSNPEYHYMFNSQGINSDRSIAVDASGNIYATGWFSKTVDFDPGAGVYSLTTFGTDKNITRPDIFISKLDASGNFVWAKQIGGLGVENPNDILIDASGNIVITGTHPGETDFDPGASTNNLPGGGTFIAKYDSSGDLIWVNQLNGIGWENDMRRIRTDKLNNVYCSGSFSGTVDFDPGTGIYNMTSNGMSDMFISKMDSSGQFGWAKHLGGTSDDKGRWFSLDETGNIYLMGGFSGNLDINPDTGVCNLSSTDSSDIFIMKLGDPSLEIEEFAAGEDGISIYPNPNGGNFVVRSAVDGYYSIQNEIGQTIQTFAIHQDSTHEIQIEGLAPGIYFIIGSGKRHAIRQKIIVLK